MSEEGVLRLLNPLNIRFSQPRIAPHFRDGHSLDETAAEIRFVDPEDKPAFPTPQNAAEGTPPYDVVVLPPFPAIRVISWMPKIRGADGEAERDEHGDQILGKRAWFALDNRRLWSLQTAAAKEWPRKCCVVVRCLEDVPGTNIKEIRKFRTTTEGKQIDLGRRAGETVPWSWLQAASDGASSVEEDTTEGLFSEGLWDALQWAPNAAAAACERDAEDFVPKKQPPRQAEVQHAAGAVNGGYRDHATRPPASNRGAAGSAAEPATCPEHGWQYLDPAGRLQGPFDRTKMRLWHEHGYFYPELMMRCSNEDMFVPFAKLFPTPIQPFLGIVMKYRLH